MRTVHQEIAMTADRALPAAVVERVAQAEWVAQYTQNYDERAEGTPEMWDHPDAQQAMARAKKEYCTRAAAALAEFLAILEERGLRVVPAYPTAGMLDAGLEADWVGEYESREGRSIMPLPANEHAERMSYYDAIDEPPSRQSNPDLFSKGIWPAMLEAAPPLAELLEGREHG